MGRLTRLGKDMLGRVNLGDDGVVVCVRGTGSQRVSSRKEHRGQRTLEPALGVLAIALVDEVVAAQRRAYTISRVSVIFS